MTRPPMPRRGSALFVERQTYRRRRLRDAARVLPLLGILLWSVPLLWGTGSNGAVASSALMYLFGVWAMLVVASALITIRLGHDDNPAKQGGDR